jgi:hypothetical protein
MALFLESDAFTVEGEAGFEILLAKVAIYLRELGVLEVVEIAEGTLKGAWCGSAAC